MDGVANGPRKYPKETIHGRQLRPGLIRFHLFDR